MKKLLFTHSTSLFLKKVVSCLLFCCLLAMADKGMAQNLHECYFDALNQAAKTDPNYVATLAKNEAKIQRYLNLQTASSSKGLPIPTAQYLIPIIIQIEHDASFSSLAVSSARIQSQLDALNNAFAPACSASNKSVLIIG